MDQEIDFDRLFKLRVVIGRFGEMDLAGWWNTRGQLGRMGSAAIRRGMPRTHYFAQSRSVFAVANNRCREIFDSPKSVTLWQLPELLEEEFESRWDPWLDRADEWEPFFQQVESLGQNELVATLEALNLLTREEAAEFPRLRRSAEGRAVPLLSPFTGLNQDVAMLALGFGRGEPGALAVPYARLGDA